MSLFLVSYEMFTPYQVWDMPAFKLYICSQELPNNIPLHNTPQHLSCDKKNVVSREKRRFVSPLIAHSLPVLFFRSIHIEVRDEDNRFVSISFPCLGSQSTQTFQALRFMSPLKLFAIFKWVVREWLSYQR